MTRPDYRNSPTLRRIAERKQDEIDRYGPIYWHFMHERGTQYIEFPNARPNHDDARNDYSLFNSAVFNRAIQHSPRPEPPQHLVSNAWRPDVAQPSIVSRPPSFLSRLASGLRSLLGLRE
jgi:hypothetical protein